LTSGVPQNGSVALGAWVYYQITTSAADTQIIVNLTNLSADVDLYVRAGANPTLTSYACRPYLGGTNPETCTLPNTGATTWHIGVHGYAAGSYTITATRQ
jgi:serine protease